VHFELVGEVSNTCKVQNCLSNCVESTCVIVVRLGMVVANFKNLQDNLLIMKLIFQVN
jgi:hypothetical protein